MAYLYYLYTGWQIKCCTAIMTGKSLVNKLTRDVAKRRKLNSNKIRLKNSIHLLSMLL